MTKLANALGIIVPWQSRDKNFQSDFDDYLNLSGAGVTPVLVDQDVVVAGDQLIAVAVLLQN